MSSSRALLDGGEVPRASFAERLGVLLSLVGRSDRRLLILMAALIVLGGVAGSALSLSLKWMLDGVLGRKPELVMTGVIVAASAAAITSVAARFNTRLQEWLAAAIGVAVNREIARDIGSIASVDHLERPKYLDQVTIVARGGIELVRSFLAVGDLLSIAIRLTTSVWLLAIVHPALCVLPVFAIPSVLLAPRAQRHIERATVEAAQKRRQADSLDRLFTSPAAGREMRIFGSAAMLDRRASDIWRDIARLKLRAAVRAASVSTLGWAVLTVGFFGALLLVVSRAASGHATSGDVLLVGSLALQFRTNVAMATAALRQSIASGRLADRYLWLAAYADEQRRMDGGAKTAPTQLRDGIRFQQVSFAYPEASKLAVNRVDLELRAGSILALVGENGSGKSTLVKLLCRSHRPTSGSILVDGVDLAEIVSADWRSQVAVTFQDFLRLETLARHSIGIGDLPSMDDVHQVAGALHRANGSNLAAGWPDDFSNHLGVSYAAGAELSGGQWQTVAIARAMMRRAPLLTVFDEPTSALDPLAEQALYERFEEVAKAARASGAVVLLISHRLSSIALADHIAVLDRGRVIEYGDHSTLMAANGHYASMYKAQAAAYD